MTTDVVATPTFFQVALAMLPPGTVLPCDVWLRHGESEPILYRAKALPFTQEHIDRLVTAGVQTLWIPFDQSLEWHSFTETNLHDRISDTSLPVTQRVQVLLDVSRPIMKDVLTNPMAPGTERRVGSLADAICELIRGPEAVAAAIQLMEHDYYTYTHSLHVSIYSVALAQAMGIVDPAQLAAIGRGGLIHDCGKCGLPAYLINKPGKLDDREWELMRGHPTRGGEILRETGWKDDIAYHACVSHHERMDGSGYPLGLAGKQIPEVARMTAICDAYDAMTTDRSYKVAMRGAQALKIIRVDQNERYDQKMVEAFIRMLVAPA